MGDPRALEDAYRQHGPRCTAIAYRVLGDDDRANDAVQEAFVSLWRHREGLVVRTAGIAPWLAVVTRNAAIAIARSEGARTRRETRAQPAVAAAGTFDPADALATKADAQDVRSALETLPAEQRSVIIFAYYESMTMSQIAERMKTPLGTVKRRAQMGLQRLARALSEQRS